MPTLSNEMGVCKWKTVYIKGSVLRQRWRKGVYEVAPLLKGHRLQVTSIDCESKCYDGLFGNYVSPLSTCAEDVLVSGSSDGTSRIWSLKSLECLHVLEGHTDAVNSVAVKVLFVSRLNQCYVIPQF